MVCTPSVLCSELVVPGSPRRAYVCATVRAKARTTGTVWVLDSPRRILRCLDRSCVEPTVATQHSVAVGTMSPSCVALIPCSIAGRSNAHHSTMGGGEVSSSATGVVRECWVTPSSSSQLRMMELISGSIRASLITMLSQCSRTGRRVVASLVAPPAALSGVLDGNG